MDIVKTGECINCAVCIEVCPRKNTGYTIFGKKISPYVASAIALVLMTGALILLPTINFSSDSSIALPDSTTSVVSTTPNPKASSGTTTNPANTTPAATTKSTTGQKYTDGTYSGTGFGYQSQIAVSVTIKSDKITNIQIVSQNDTPEYFRRSNPLIPNRIKSLQTTNIDVFTGATYSAKGITSAVENALSKALVK